MDDTGKMQSTVRVFLQIRGTVRLRFSRYLTRAQPVPYRYYRLYRTGITVRTIPYRYNGPYRTGVTFRTVPVYRSVSYRYNSPYRTEAVRSGQHGTEFGRDVGCDSKGLWQARFCVKRLIKLPCAGMCRLTQNILRHLHLLSLVRQLLYRHKL